MTTNLAIDDDLINEALTLGHFKTKEDTVVTALREFINAVSKRKLSICSANSTLILITITSKGGILESIGRYLHLVACVPF